MTTPPGLWCPFATHKPIPEAWTQRAIDTRAVVVHSAGGHGELFGWWQSDASHGLESTFFICDDRTRGYLDGEIIQYLGLGIKADANGAANSFAASIETASTVQAAERWTPAQAKSLTLLLDWICTSAPKVERRLMTHPTDAGIAWHVQFGAPGPWTPSRGKVCPGPQRVKQLQAEIIPAVARLGNRTPGITLTPFPGTIRPGDVNTRVQKWGFILTGLGYHGFNMKGQASTVMGPGKVAATRRFQGRHGLTVDGIVGPATWAKANGVLLAKHQAKRQGK